MAAALSWVQVEEPTTQYEQVMPPLQAHSGWLRRSVCALMLVAGVVLWLAPSQMTDAPSIVHSDAASLAERSASLETSARLADLSTAVPLATAVHEKAHIVIIRHGEKDTRQSSTGQGLSDVGQKRAQYLARCMSQATPTVAMPFGPPTYVMASHGKPSKSHRPIDTVVPLAEALGVTLDSDIYFGDTEEFASHIQEVLQPSMTLVASWHHGEIPNLVKELLGQEKEKLDALGWLQKWPRSCGTERWQEPSYLPRSDQCYDLLWRITLLRVPHKDELPHAERSKPEYKKRAEVSVDETDGHSKIKRFGWRAASLTATLEGFRGSELDPCREGLTPVAPTKGSSSSHDAPKGLLTSWPPDADR